MPLAILIAANLIPVAGVLLWEWSVFEIVALYWFENVVIGAVNILKLTACSGDLRDPNLIRHQEELPTYMRTPPAPAVIRHGAKLFLIPFFTFHYGMFCFVHGMFVFILLGGKAGGNTGGDPVSGMRDMISGVFETGGKWFALAIVASHLFSFGWNFIGKGEYLRHSLKSVMAAPYGRIVVLHIAIIFGAFVTAALGSPVYLLLLLIAGKILLDAKLHLRSHREQV
ncbi:MAG: hypothetical protein RLZZ505_2364 [Verrucomicrobiota bacterium]|jgi:hypothetical protein